jgi:hypothetical protein
MGNYQWSLLMNRDVIDRLILSLRSDPALAGERACTPKCVSARRRGNLSLFKAGRGGFSLPV